MARRSVARVDVAIVGGGPGGCATALSLADHVPSLSVSLIEASAYERPRVGESLPPPASRMLRHLGVWEAFLGAGHLEVHGTASAWGRSTLQQDDFLFSARGSGWHLDRSRFDQLLAHEAERRGTRLRLATRLLGLRRAAEGWRLELSDGGEIAAAFVVDATGRKATVGRRQGAVPEALDRMVGYGRFFDEAHDRDPRTLVEACEDGWWYTAGLPGGRRIAFFMTDLDLGRRLGLKGPERWSAAQAKTRRIRAVLEGATPVGKMLVRPVETRCLHPAAGDDWLAVGDAVSIFDPLSSQGISKALRGGVFASYAIGDLLVKRDPRGLVRYRRYVRGELDGYLETRRDVYSAERRWPEADFWRRRQLEPIDREAPASD